MNQTTTIDEASQLAVGSVQDASPEPTHESAPSWRLLCVDDEPNILSSLRRLLRQNGYEVVIASSGAEGIAALEASHASTAGHFDLVISDMRMPEMDGARFLEQVHSRWPETIRILLTGYADIASTVAAINKGQIYRYISKPWDDNDLLAVIRHALERKALEREKNRLEALALHQNQQLKALNESLEAKVEARTAELASANKQLTTSFLTSIKVFANLIDLREPSLAGHSRRVADLSRKLAIKLRLSPSDEQDVFIAGLLHDIGKIGLPDELLGKGTSQMSTDELHLYRRHPVNGEQSLMALAELQAVGKLIRSHHERYDGLGYPDRLVGAAIPMGARILAVANDFDGLQIGLIGARRLSVGEARKQIADGGGSRYDPRIIDTFLGIEVEAESIQSNEIALTTHELKPGMAIARDLVGQSGFLLLTAEYVLNSKLIEQIRAFETREGSRLTIFVRPERK